MIYEVDAVVDGEVWQFKAPKGGPRNTISGQLKRAGKQAGRLVLDLRRRGLDGADAIEEVERRFYGHRTLVEVVVIDHDGGLHRYTR